MDPWIQYTYISIYFCVYSYWCSNRGLTNNAKNTGCDTNAKDTTVIHFIWPWLYLTQLHMYICVFSIRRLERIRLRRYRQCIRGLREARLFVENVTIMAMWATFGAIVHCAIASLLWDPSLLRCGPLGHLVLDSSAQIFVTNGGAAIQPSVHLGTGSYVSMSGVATGLKNFGPQAEKFCMEWRNAPWHLTNNIKEISKRIYVSDSTRKKWVGTRNGCSSYGYRSCAPTNLKRSWETYCVLFKSTKQRRAELQCANWKCSHQERQ